MPSGSSITVLLGAGASIEAGVPDSTDLTRAIVDTIDRNQRHRFTNVQRALHYAIGALVRYDTARGGRAFDGIDVERLFSAVDLIARRHDLDVAPFVSSWDATIETFVETRSFDIDRNVERFLSNAFSDRGFYGSDFAKAVRSVVGDPGAANQAFVALGRAMTQALRELTSVSTERTHYLEPLLRLPHPTHIATLNYDCSVEQLCAYKQIKVDTGIGAWSGGYSWSWEADADIRLLKLHGSIDWRYSEDWRRRRWALVDPTVTIAAQQSDDQFEPAIVFGHGKLRSDGPFLAMLGELDVFLQDARTLVVVGYSFRDDHVNAVIRRWVLRDRDRVLYVVDPGFDLNRSGLARPEGPTFRDLLAQSLLSDVSRPKLKYKNKPDLFGELRVIEEPASRGLRQVVDELLKPG